MGTLSPFIHAWVLPAEIEPAAWAALHREVVQVLRTASATLEKDRQGDALAVLRGPNGFGPLVIQPDSIAFNGNAFLGHAGDALVLERVAQAGILSRRLADGSRRAVHRCDTGGHAYDLAVCATLMAMVRVLGDRVRVGTSGTLRIGWGRAAAVVREATREGGQVVQQENGVIRWVRGVSSTQDQSRSSA